MGALKTYDPKNVTIVWDGLILNDGIVEGTFLTISRTSPNSETSVGGDGGVTMVIKHDRTATLTLTLRKGTDTNDDLTDVVAADEAAESVKRVGVFQVQDFNGRTFHISNEAFLTGPPDDEFSTDESETQWTWMLPKAAIQVRGSNEAAGA